MAQVGSKIDIDNLEQPDSASCQLSALAVAAMIQVLQHKRRVMGVRVVKGSVVEWLKHRTDDQHGLGSKPTCAILLCPWERHFTALSPAWWS